MVGNWRQLVLCILFLWLASDIDSIAEEYPRTKANFAKEFRAIEAEVISIIQRSFPDNKAFPELIERYTESIDNSEWVANFNAISNYLITIFEPTLQPPSPTQAIALKKLRSMIDRYDALQIEYASLYKKLPPFD